MRRHTANGMCSGTATRSAIPDRRPRSGVEGAWADECSPDSPPLEADAAGDVYEPAFHESSVGTALYGDGDFSRDDGGSPLVA
jgi:hypothetical protein